MPTLKNNFSKLRNKFLSKKMMIIYAIALVSMGLLGGLIYGLYALVMHLKKYKSLKTSYGNAKSELIKLNDQINDLVNQVNSAVKARNDNYNLYDEAKQNLDTMTMKYTNADTNYKKYLKLYTESTEKNENLEKDYKYAQLIYNDILPQYKEAQIQYEIYQQKYENSNNLYLNLKARYTELLNISSEAKVALDKLDKAILNTAEANNKYYEFSIKSKFGSDSEIILAQKQKDLAYKNWKKAEEDEHAALIKFYKSMGYYVDFVMPKF